MQGYNCIIVYNEGADRLLFCKRTRDPYKGKYNLVGGKINELAGGTEDGFHAAYRELQEETGIRREDICLSHLIDFTYYNQDCYMEVYCGQLKHPVELREEAHPLHWLSTDEDFFDADRFAGEGNIGHMIQQIDDYGAGQSMQSNDPKERGESSSPRSGRRNRRYSVLCYGDSNTYGYNPLTGMRYDSSIRWPGLMQKLLGQNFSVIEEGCNGRTVCAEDSEEPWKNGMFTLRPCLNTHKPVDFLVIMLGSNDLKKQFQLAPSDITDGVKKMLETAIAFTREKQAYAPEIVLVSPAWLGEKIRSSPFAESFSCDAVRSSRQLAGLYERLASDLNDNMLSASGQPPRIHFIDAARYISSSDADSLHLMPEAHSMLAQIISEKIQDIMKDINRQEEI